MVIALQVFDCVGPPLGVDEDLVAAVGVPVDLKHLVRHLLRLLELLHVHRILHVQRSYFLNLLLLFLDGEVLQIILVRLHTARSIHSDLDASGREQRLLGTLVLNLL